MEIYVIRHTKVSVGSGICYGQSNLAVSDTFHEEAEKLKMELVLPFDSVYSSPLTRCIKLAKKFDDSIILDDRLKEMDFGDWEMKPWNEIPKQEIEQWYSDYVNTSVPNGENFKMVYERLCSFMEDIRLSFGNQKILIICHGGIIRSIWCYLLQIPLHNAFKIPVGFSEILHFNLGKDASEDFIIQKK